MVNWKKTYKKSKKYSRYGYKLTGLKNPVKKGNVSMTRVIKDLAKLKEMVNAEKQNITSSVTTEYDLAQYNGVSSSGSRVLAGVFPAITQGVGEDNRKGDSLKVCSWVLKLQVYNNGNDTLSGVNYKFYVVRQPTNPSPTTSDTIGDFLETNPFSGVLDYYSNRNYEHYKDFIVMGVISGKLKANDSGDVNQGSKTNTHTLARKQEFHIRYDKGTTDIINNKIYLIAVASDGDRSTTNKIFFKYSSKFYFYDN